MQWNARGHFLNSQYFLQINGTSHFANDLGLDSLDVVEAVMAVEEVHNDTIVQRERDLSRGALLICLLYQEFSIEIPDKEADAIHSGTFSSIA